MVGKSVKIDSDLLNQVVASFPDGESKKACVESVLRRGLFGVELDDSETHRYFERLTAGKGKDYHADLMPLELTEKELVELACKKSGLRVDELIKIALLSYAQNEVTLAARREWLDANEDPNDASPETRLRTTFADFAERLASGERISRNNRITVSLLAKTAKVNYTTAQKWAERNQPEILGGSV